MNENNLSVIIIARYSSQRLRGKVLMEIEGKSALNRIVTSLLNYVMLSNICIATSKDASDDEIEKFALKHGVKIYRGSLQNVSERFYQAAKLMGKEYACRINGDNVFVNGESLSMMVPLLKTGNYNFLSNVKGRTYPKGMSVEIVKLSFYKSIYPEIMESDYHKEHVMSYLYELNSEKNQFYFQKNEDIKDAAGIQLALDTIEDFNRISWLLKRVKTSDVNSKNIPKLVKLYYEYENK